MNTRDTSQKIPSISIALKAIYNKLERKEDPKKIKPYCAEVEKIITGNLAFATINIKNRAIHHRWLAELYLQWSKLFSNAEDKKKYLDLSLKAAHEADRLLPDDKIITLQQADALGALGNFYANKKEFRKAIQCNQQAIKLYATRKETDSKYQDRYIHYHRCIGHQLFCLSEEATNYSDKKTCLMESIKYYFSFLCFSLEELNKLNRDIIGEYFMICNRFDQLVSDRSESTEVIKILEQAYDVAKKWSDHKTAAGLCGLLGKRYDSMSRLDDGLDGKVSEAEKNFDRAATWFRQGMHHEMTFHQIGPEDSYYLYNRHHLEKLYRAMASWKLNVAKKPDDAIDWAIIAEELGRKNKEPKKQGYTETIFGNCFWKKRNYYQAFQYYDQSIVHLSQSYLMEKKKDLLDQFTQHEKEVYLILKNNPGAIDPETLKEVGRFHDKVNAFLKKESQKDSLPSKKRTCT